MFRLSMKRAFGLALAVFLVFASLAPAGADPAPTFEVIPNAVRVPVVASGIDEGTRVAAPPTPRGAQSATFTVNYDASFQANPDARTAFQAAVDIWASQLTSTVPITVDAHWTPLGTNILGSAGFTYGVQNTRTNVYYPAPLGASLAGRNFRPNQAMIDASFSSTASWYYGTDGNTPRGKIDFESVVLHELGHGLGFAGTGDLTNGIGRVESPPLVYDVSVVDGTGVSVLNIANNSAVMATLLRSGNLFWGGANAVANNGGVRPKLYAPATWQDGSSYSHLDEATYRAGNPNSLMTPSIGSAEAIHDPGPITRGMFADMGWTVGAPPANNPLPAALAYRTFIPVGSRGAGT
jgi:hypothetical protein